MASLEELRKDPVFKYFIRLTQIPRCSYDEKRVGQYLLEAGRALGLEVEQDAAGNVRILRPGQGPQKDLKVILQGHMDMVCVKAPDSDHDFTCMPLDLVLEDGWLRAKGTTLGADDGIGVAMGLALLEEEGPLPEIQVLVTTSEEVGMDGAMGLSPDWLDADMLINIDSEEEGYVTIGCAGGADGNFTLALEREESSEKRVGFHFTIDQLKGGHSGTNILTEPNNAGKIMSECLQALSQQVDFRLHRLTFGEKHNAIPSRADAWISVLPEEEASFQEALKAQWEALLERIFKQEPDMQMALEAEELRSRPLTQDAGENLLGLINILPHGVYQMLADGSGVLASDNLAIVRTEEKEAKISLSTRSSSKAVLAELQEEITKAANTFQATGTFSNGYPAWEPAEHSPLRERFLEIYRQESGQEAKILNIHAGLECGLFAQKNPKLDMISIGPDVQGAHTPAERLSIASTQRTYGYLKKLLHSLGK